MNRRRWAAVAASLVVALVGAPFIEQFALLERGKGFHAPIIRELRGKPSHTACARDRLD
jgi:hypothetical protein